MRGEARADVAHELQARSGVRVRGPVDAILQDQVLLGERLGLAVVPRRAERVRDVVREAERDVRVAREAGGVPPRLAQEPQCLGGVPAGEQEAGQIRCGQERLGVARPPQAPLLPEDGLRQLQGVRRAAAGASPEGAPSAGAPRLVSSITSSRNLDIAGRN